MAVTRIHKLVILEKNKPVKVIDSTTSATAMMQYKEKDIEDIEPYIEHHTDCEGDLKITAKLSVYVYD